ncbi:MAG TPA: potassium transporter TrkG [Candidatus Nanopelagicales bacterium]
MPLRRPHNEPRRRMRRARSEIPESNLTVQRAAAGGDSQVAARTKQRQARIARSSPTRTVVVSFAVLCVVGTGLLMLPGMHSGGGVASPLTALFTAVSAICVTGLTVVDTEVYWSPLGQVTILLLVQVGGFGIQALGTLWILMLHRKLGTASRLAAQAETGALTQGDVRRVLRALAVITLVVESLVALVLALRFATAYDHSWARAAWFGVFHSVTAFNNAGFDILTDFDPDPLILGPIGLAVVLGGLGFLVIVEVFTRTTGARPLRPWRLPPPPQSLAEISARGRELARRSRYRLGGFHPERFGFANPIPMSLHTRLMLAGTAALIVVGSALFLLLEWANPATLGPMPIWEKLNVGVFMGGISPRTAGFSAVDYTQVVPETRLLTDVLMFIGAGSGSTAGGIKVTTLVILLLAAWAEIRGHPDVTAMDRRIPEATVRIAIAVTMVSATAVVAGTMALEATTSLGLDYAIFETISALATVGLSANVTPTLPAAAQLLVALLMFLGRVGPLTLASSLTLRGSVPHHRLPEGRPMIG